jgi:hypothetical protein
MPHRLLQIILNFNLVVFEGKPGFNFSLEDMGSSKLKFLSMQLVETLHSCSSLLCMVFNLVTACVQQCSIILLKDKVKPAEIPHRLFFDIQL